MSDGRAVDRGALEAGRFANYVKLAFPLQLSPLVVWVAPFGVGDLVEAVGTEALKSAETGFLRHKIPSCAYRHLSACDSTRSPGDERARQVPNV
jgi:hypothetical protein